MAENPTDWYAFELCDEVELAELLYKRNPVVTATDEPAKTWAEAQQGGWDKHYYVAASAMLAVIGIAQRRLREFDAAPSGKPADAEPLLPDGYEWTICELMGHVCHVGRVIEVERFGGKMARVDVPKAGADGAVAWEPHFFTAGAVYRLTPCDEETAMRRARPAPAIGRHVRLPWLDDAPSAYDGEPGEQYGGD